MSDLDKFKKLLKRSKEPSEMESLEEVCHESSTAAEELYLKTEKAAELLREKQEIERELYRLRKRDSKS